DSIASTPQDPISSLVAIINITTSPGTRKEPDIAEVKSSDRMCTNVTRSITFGRHELTPYRDVSIMDADDLERTDNDQRIHRYVQKGLPCIPRLRAD
ncbi:hypothetical protein scyTo_0019800, partial [Scyliorhinus torazame]|nr:hypothetical protein [Scyliorhinus torazame]